MVLVVHCKPANKLQAGTVLVHFCQMLVKVLMEKQWKVIMTIFFECLNMGYELEAFFMCCILSVGPCSATTNAAATADFLAAYDAKGSPLAELQVFNEAGRICKGAPSVAIYDDIKADATQEVVMTFFVEDSVGISGRTEAEKISKMLSLTMRQAMTELTDELMTEGKCAAFISTNGQPVSNQVKYSTRVVNAYLLHPVSDSSICAPAQMLTRDEFIIQPAYAFAMMCPTAVAIATQILANAGFEPAQAASMAIIHAPFQVMEALNIKQHGTGQVIFTAATRPGADALKQMPDVEFGIQEQFSAWLFPDVTQASRSMQYALVSSEVHLGHSFAKAALYKHVDELLQLAYSKAAKMTKPGSALIVTPASNVRLHFYGLSNEIVTVTLDNTKAAVDSIIFVPRGQGVGCLPEGMLAAKANTRTGFKWMLKPADQLTAVLVLTAGAENRRAAKMTGNQVWYTTSSNSAAGDIQLGKPSSMTSTTVATLVVA